MKRELVNINNTTGWAPAESAGTGTVVIRGKFVIGTGTAFESELKRGAFITVAGEGYEVQEVRSDTDARLVRSGTNVSVTAAFGIISKRVRQLDWTVSADADVTIDGETVEAGNSHAEIADIQPLSPIYVDATGGNVQVNVLYS